MPEITIVNKGVTPSVRKVPTATCAVVMPMTLDRVGREAASDSEEPTNVESVADAFAKFQPRLVFEGHAGEEDAEFRAEVQFRGIKDFDPENLQRHQEIKEKNNSGREIVIGHRRNDIADLRSNIDLLNALKDRWKSARVRRAWSVPDQRREIIEALGRLRVELETVATKGGMS
jgi:type VI secretion system protein ImpB